MPGSVYALLCFLFSSLTLSSLLLSHTHPNRDLSINYFFNYFVKTKQYNFLLCTHSTYSKCKVIMAHFTNHQVFNKKLTPIDQQANKMYNNTLVLLIEACLAPIKAFYQGTHSK